MGEMDQNQMFNESLDLFRKVENMNDPGEIELISEAEKEAGITRKIKYDLMNNRRIRFSYAGNIFYVELPTIISGREEIYDFIDSILQKLNAAVHPARFISQYKKKKGEKTTTEKSPEEPEEEKPKEEE